jgi:hypothetical protein
MRTLVFTQSNIVPDGQNNKLRYNFPNSILFKKNSIAVASVNMYYAWNNIATIYQNNTLTYTWTVAGVSTPYPIIIPDGTYEVSDLNNLLQYEFIKNGHYLKNATGQNVYYGEFILNPNRYAVQINTFLVPTSLPAGFTQPANFAGYPTQTFNPIITIPASLNIILGFSVNYATPDNVNNDYTPPTGQSLIAKDATTGTISCLSTQAPNLQPNSSVYLSMSNVNNPYSIPTSIIYSITAQGGVGTLITEKTPQYAWNKMIDGTYNNLTITILGNDFSPIQINDPQMTIMLVIKEDGELD